MRTTNIEWVAKRIELIRKFNEKTERQQEIIRLLDIENRTSLEQKQLHVLATAEKNELQRQETAQRLAIQERIANKKKRRERNHQMFLSAGMLTLSGLVDKVTGKPNYDPERLIQSFTRFNEKLKKSNQ
ncbi:hypothetical protein VQV48_003976 [Providencia rettgeri]|uniref:hypothetical protein n=1 Tax=Providencia sp. Me31A TaxID=3392637 RepID=UPI002AB34A7E|nr:hypothetical protein [Providencia rettgeri]HEM8308188.1 hypothetical protein [Providencia rettgeri]